MVLGALMLLGALGLFLRNNRETETAQAASAVVLPEIKTAIEIRGEQEETEPEEEVPNTPPELLTQEELVMTESVISGRNYIGYLYIPKLELELPILSNWSYENLKTAPCRYSGSPRDGDLVLLAHNYKTHFGPIRRLKPGDRVVFQDTEGTVFEYQVAATEVVSPSALKEVTAGVHDLTLITCTYGGKTRLVVSCDAVTK